MYSDVCCVVLHCVVLLLHTDISVVAAWWRLCFRADQEMILFWMFAHIILLNQPILYCYYYAQHQPQKRYDSRNYTASEIFFDVHLSLDNLDTEFEMSGKSLDD